MQHNYNNYSGCSYHLIWFEFHLGGLSEFSLEYYICYQTDALLVAVPELVQYPRMGLFDYKPLSAGLCPCAIVCTKF